MRASISPRQLAVRKILIGSSDALGVEKTAERPLCTKEGSIRTSSHCHVRLRRVVSV